MSVMDKLKKSSKLKTSSVMSESMFFENSTLVDTGVPMLNVALSGEIDGGLTSGVTIIAGPSKHFKSSLALLMAGAYLRSKPNAVMLFYDSEFGTPGSYLSQHGIDPARVLHTPIMNIEDLKFDIISQLEGLDRKDDVIIVVDSIGNLASKKEIDDAVNEKSVADMTRAKALKGLFRMITPYMTTKDIPFIGIAHTYDTQELYCLHGDTLIKTGSGLMPISKIEVGDMVYAKDGLREVTRKYLPHELPSKGVKYMKLRFDDGTEIKCTDTHKFLMKDGSWKCAGDIKLGEEFM